jgi:glycosyltransferase involved in cell wall biosynthesis
MRLLFVLPYYPPYAIGGAEESTLILARSLLARGHDVLVLAPRQGARKPEVDVPLRLIDVGFDEGVAGVGRRPRVYDRPRLQLCLARAVRDAARDRDIVHCHGLPLLPAAYVGARRASVPIVATIRDLGAVCPVVVCLLTQARVPHDCGVWKLERECVGQFVDVYGGARARRHVVAPLQFAIARLRAALLDRCNAVVSVSRDLAQLYVDARLVEAQRLRVLPNIADLEGNVDGEHASHALYAGKVSPGKGVAQLLDAVRIARAERPDFRLVIAGQAEEPWRGRVLTTDGVEYVGRVPRAQLARLYAEARFAVIPSIWPEPLPRAVLEAAHAGVPVVAAATGGIPETVESGETGLLVEPHDAAALARAMVELWDDAPRARAMGEAARQLAEERFAAAVVCAQAEQLYSSLVA